MIIMIINGQEQARPNRRSPEVELSKIVGKLSNSHDLRTPEATNNVKDRTRRRGLLGGIFKAKSPIHHALGRVMTPILTGRQAGAKLHDSAELGFVKITKVQVG